MLLLLGRKAAMEHSTITPLFCGVLVSPEALANFSFFLLSDISKGKKLRFSDQIWK